MDTVRLLLLIFATAASGIIGKYLVVQQGDFLREQTRKYRKHGMDRKKARHKAEGDFGLHLFLPLAFYCLFFCGTLQLLLYDWTPVIIVWLLVVAVTSSKAFTPRPRRSGKKDRGKQ